MMYYLSACIFHRSRRHSSFLLCMYHLRDITGGKCISSYTRIKTFSSGNVKYLIIIRSLAICGCFLKFCENGTHSDKIQRRKYFIRRQGNYIQTHFQAFFKAHFYIFSERCTKLKECTNLSSRRHIAPEPMICTLLYRSTRHLMLCHTRNTQSTSSNCAQANNRNQNADSRYRKLLNIFQ